MADCPFIQLYSTNPSSFLKFPFSVISRVGYCASNFFCIMTIKVMVAAREKAKKSESSVTWQEVHFFSVASFGFTLRRLRHGLSTSTVSKMATTLFIVAKFRKVIKSGELLSPAGAAFRSMVPFMKTSASFIMDQ